jgi:hypothetical protein
MQVLSLMPDQFKLFQLLIVNLSRKVFAHISFKTKTGCTRIEI